MHARSLLHECHLKPRRFAALAARVESLKLQVRGDYGGRLMQLRNNQQRYGAVAQVFHWIIVVLIITQFFLAIKADGLPLGPAKIAVLAQHKSVGMTIFALAVLRLVWRLINPIPPMPAATPRWQSIGAHLSHF